MLSKRPLLKLTADELPLYESIDGQRTAAELEGISPGATQRLLRWYEAEVLELIPPSISMSRPHLVVIEPHMDDAVLSAGGRLLKRRGHNRVTILSVVRWSNFTSYLLSRGDLLDVREVSDLRQREAALVARMLGAEHRCLDWTDAPLRFRAAGQWSPALVEKFKKDPQAFVKMPPNHRDVVLLAAQLLRELSILDPDELWIPMGVGEHIDHRTTRSACLLMLAQARECFSQVRVSMYEDVPYASEPGHAKQICTALANCGTSSLRLTEDISDVLDEKMRLSSVYASQFKSSYIESIIRRFADREASTTGRPAEAYYHLEGLGSLPQESQFARDWHGLAKLRTKLHRLLQKPAHPRNLSVIALPSAHLVNWIADTELLTGILRNAHIRFYVSSELAWQMELGVSVKVTSQVVRGWSQWITIFLREVLHFRTPTVVMWRGAYSATPPMRPVKKPINLLIRCLFPFRPVFFARRLGDICCVLNEIACESPTLKPDTRAAESYQAS